MLCERLVISKRHTVRFQYVHIIRSLNKIKQLLDLVETSDYVYILETNGMTLGNDKAFAKQLASYKNLHVRVSIKGTSQEEFHDLTDAIPESSQEWRPLGRGTPLDWSL